jgi:glycosyltransferase involved in cell wall biosynthesis
MKQDVWKEIKVLLVPSLWFEAWGMVVVEAQLCGIPVVSSDSGGLPEAKLGVPYILPVNPLTGEHDEDGKYVVHDQDIQPWVETLQTLLNDEDEYESVSTQARRTTVEWLSTMDGRALEKWLGDLKQK